LMSVVQFELTFICLSYNSRGSEVREVTAPTQTPSSPALNEAVGTESQRITAPSPADEMLQNTAVQRIKGDNPTTGLTSRRLVTRPTEIIITFKPQCKDDRTANLTNYGKKT